MAKVTIEFNLPDEQMEYFMATNGSKFHNVLWDVTQAVREKWKYGTKLDCTWDEVWELLWNIYKDNSFDPYDEEGM
jgi:hypothetical protein